MPTGYKVPPISCASHPSPECSTSQVASAASAQYKKHLIEYSKTDSPEAFQEFLKKEFGDQLVLVDFWAPWCGPCRALTPTLTKAIEEKIVCVVKVNVDSFANLSGHFAVRSIPFLVLMRNGKAIESKAGALSLTEIKRWVEHAEDSKPKAQTVS